MPDVRDDNGPLTRKSVLRPTSSSLRLVRMSPAARGLWRTPSGALLFERTLGEVTAQIAVRDSYSAVVHAAALLRCRETRSFRQRMYLTTSRINSSIVQHLWLRVTLWSGPSRTLDPVVGRGVGWQEVQNHLTLQRRHGPLHRWVVRPANVPTPPRRALDSWWPSSASAPRRSLIGDLIPRGPRRAGRG